MSAIARTEYVMHVPIQCACRDTGRAAQSHVNAIRCAVYANPFTNYGHILCPTADTDGELTVVSAFTTHLVASSGGIRRWRATMFIDAWTAPYVRSCCARDNQLTCSSDH